MYQQAFFFFTFRSANNKAHAAVARALWSPRPDLKTATTAWIFAGGAHHTSFSYSVTAENLRDFANMAGIEFLLIDENTNVETFKEKLRWNELYYLLSKGI
jgi:L-arabinose isomerase